MEPNNAVQQALGLHTTAQNNTGNPNNGNPNTVYNTAAPTTTAGQAGATSPWIGTMAANPINMPFNAVGLLPPPQFASTGSGGSAVSDILARIGTGNFGLPGTGTYTPPPTGTPQPTPVTGPGVTAPVGAIGTPVGPISGPTYQDPNAWQRNYANAQPNTSIYESGNGRWGNLPWMPVNQTGPQFNQQGFGTDLSPEKTLDLYKSGSQWGDLGSKAVDLLLGKDFKADITGQNGWKGALSQLANVFIPGGNAIVDAIFGQNEAEYSRDPKLFKDKAQELSNVLRLAKSGNLTKEQINSKLDDLVKSVQQGSGTDYRSYYNNQPAMSRTQWNNTVDRSRFIGMFANGQAHDTTSQMLRDLQNRFDSVAKNPVRKVQK